MIIGAVCREPFVQVELEPTAAAGPELFAEAGERGVEVETAAASIEDDVHRQVGLRGDDQAPVFGAGKLLELAAQGRGVGERQLDGRVAHLNPAPLPVLRPPRSHGHDLQKGGNATSVLVTCNSEH